MTWRTLTYSGSLPFNGRSKQIDEPKMKTESVIGTLFDKPLSAHNVKNVLFLSWFCISPNELLLANCVYYKETLAQVAKLLPINMLKRFLKQGQWNWKYVHFLTAFFLTFYGLPCRLAINFPLKVSNVISAFVLPKKIHIQSTEMLPTIDHFQLQKVQLQVKKLQGKTFLLVSRSFNNFTSQDLNY